MHPAEAKAFPYGRPWERERGSRVIRPARELVCTSVDEDEDEPIDFGTGGQEDCGPRAVVDNPDCRGFVPICGMSKVGGLVRNQAGTAAWALNVVPTTTKYFLPRAVRMLVIDSADPQLVRRVWIAGVSINNFPQESVHTVPAVAGTVAVFPSDDYTAPDGYAVPVRWGVFSIAALIENLVINGWSDYAAGINCNIQMSIYGHPFSETDAPGCKVGQPLTEGQKDRFAARLRRTQSSAIPQ